MDDEVVGTGQGVDIDHLRPLPNLLHECADPATRAGLQGHRDHRLQRQSDGGWIDIGVKAADDPDILGAAHPTVAGGRGDADRFGQCAVGHAGIVVQKGEDPAVDVIEFRRPKILRFFTNRVPLIRNFFTIGGK